MFLCYSNQNDNCQNICSYDKPTSQLRVLVREELLNRRLLEKKLKIQSFQDKKRKTGENYKNSHSLGRRKQSLSLERKENSAVVSGILLIRKNSPCHLRNIKEMMYLGKFKNSCFPEGYEKPAVFWEKKESAPVWGGKNESLWLGKN